MKLLSLILVLAAASISIRANAQLTPLPPPPPQPVTFYFYSAGPDKDFDGSSITWNGESILGWNMIDGANPADSLSSAANNSTASGIHLSPTDWSFNITANAGTGGFQGQDNFGSPPNSHLEFNSANPLDPPGSWVTTPLPDVSGTLPLLGIGLLGLATCKKFLKGCLRAG